MMSLKLMWFVVLLNFSSLMAQNEPLSQEDIEMIQVSDTLTIINRKELFVTRYVSGVLEFDQQIINDLFYDRRFDLNHQYLVDGSHQPVSIRKEILGRISKTEVLKKILTSENENLHMKYTTPKGNIWVVPIPYENYSTYELIKLRIQELES